ncbi:MAG: hypothetical protein ABL311_18955 [Nitratireductor rhodophyticola]|uniref:COG3904 family protein n=1 Tax=Nitratireductor rhodophyticola TaxID=2854036 RepID=UPI0032D908AD
MEFVYTSPQTEVEELIGGHFCVNAFGTIETGDANRFKRFIEASRVPPRTTVYIHSTGGNVEEAMEIGRSIRDGWLGTSVGKYILDADPSISPMVPRRMLPGKCLSAATLVYLGGRLRFLDGDARFGVHQFSFKNPSPEILSKSQMLSARIARYIVDMGINPEFLELSASVESERIELVSKGELERLGVVTGGMTNPEWTVQARGGGIYARGERDSLFGHHKVMLIYERNLGFAFIGVIEAQGRERELTSFGLVEIVVNGEDIRIDITSRCERKINGIYVNILVPITEDEARTLAYSESFGVQVRYNREAELFLGISAMNTEGGEEILRSVFASGASK